MIGLFVSSVSCTVLGEEAEAAHSVYRLEVLVLLLNTNDTSAPAGLYRLDAEAYALIADHAVEDDTSACDSRCNRVDIPDSLIVDRI